MTLKLVGICILTVSVSAFGQDASFMQALTDVSQKVQYPPIARAARVQGDILIKLGEKPEVVSGPAMLRVAALDNVQQLVVPPGVTEVMYHFILEAPLIRTSSIQVKTGSAAGRFFRKLAKRPTTETQLLSSCEERKEVTVIEPAISLSGSTLHIWKYYSEACLRTESSSLVASR